MLCISLSAYAADLTTEGTDFWVTFLKNNEVGYHDQLLELQLLVSAKEDATVKCVNPYTEWSVTATVKANNVIHIQIPDTVGYIADTEQVGHYGLHVVATAPISLYASNYYPNSYDATIVFPTTALNTDYIVQTYESKEAKELAIVGTAPNTQVHIQTHSESSEGIAPNQTIHLTLNEGETYQLMSYDNSLSFSGTTITASRPIGVFAGHQCSQVPAGQEYCDHLVEQQTPTSLWGQQFAITKTAEQTTNQVRLTAKDNNTEIRRNGKLVATIQRAETYQFSLTENSTFVETSAPTACFLYVGGGATNNHNGDPSSVSISPIEQRVQSITFARFLTPMTRTHYVNIVTTAKAKDGVLLDGTAVSSFSPVTGNSDLYYAQLRLSNTDVHSITCERDGFIGYVYGIGNDESYAYSIGSATISLNCMIKVNGRAVTQDDELDPRCPRTPIHFSPKTNGEYDNIYWYFGDGTSSTLDENIHTYAAPGNYKVRMVVTQGAIKDTAMATIHIVDALQTDSFIYICQGGYANLGEVQYYQDGVYPITKQSVFGCDSIINIHVEYYDEVHVDAKRPLHSYDTTCYNHSGLYYFKGRAYKLPKIINRESEEFLDTMFLFHDYDQNLTYVRHIAMRPFLSHNTSDTAYMVKGQPFHWQGMTLTQPGHYHRDTTYSCDCTLSNNLNLMLRDTIRDSICHNGYYWLNSKAYYEPGIYHDTAVNAMHGYTYYTIYLTKTDKDTIIRVSDVPSYDFGGETLQKTGQYRHVFEAANGCDSTVILHLGVNEPYKYTRREERVICFPNTYTWHGTEYSESGTYEYISDPFYPDPLQPDYREQIIYQLVLSVVNPDTLHTTINLCPGTQYRWKGKVYTDEGDYYYTRSSTTGCSNVEILHLRHTVTYNHDVSETICYGSAYTWQGTAYTEEGDYTRHLTSQYGCDSTVTLHLKISDHIERYLRDTICQNETYLWNGEKYTETGQYRRVFSAVNGCDSIVYLDLYVRPTYIFETSHTTCSDEPYTWRGKTYSRSGEYREEYMTTEGCDSIYILHLTVFPKIDLHFYDTICEGEQYRWSNNTYTETGVYTYRYISQQGCDSILSLNLTVMPRYDTHLSTTICEGDRYTWEGKTYTKAGEYTSQYRSIYGCDSIVRLSLNIAPRYEQSFTETINDGEIFRWEGDEYSTAGKITKVLHSAFGCDSTVTIDLRVIPLVVSSTFSTECGDPQSAQLDITLEQGIVDSIRLVFDEKASAYFQNMTIDPQASPLTFEHAARAGQYSLELQHIHNSHVIRTDKIPFTVLYPASVMEQHWNKFIGVLTYKYNGGYEFTAFQWFKNGEMLVSETLPYLNNDIETGARYSVLLTEDNGTQLMSCELVAQMVETGKSQSMPSLMNRDETVEIKLSAPSTLQLVDAVGRLMYSEVLTDNTITFTAPSAAGVYMVVLTNTDTEEITSYKIVVR